MSITTSALLSMLGRAGARPALPAALFFIACAAACPRPVVQNGACEADADCGDFRFCDPAGTCRCLSNEACSAGEFCNLAGSCQQSLNCITDDDCATADNPSSICDTRAPIPAEDTLSPEDNVQSRTAGQCVTLNATNKQCLLDSHCTFGAYCNSGICQPGCRDNGDCPLGDPCIGNVCNPAPGACNEPGYCEFGQICDLERFVCEDHRSPELCERCRGDDPLGASQCTCLIDNTIPGGLCTTDDQCAQGYCVKFPCASAADCPTGETCDGGGLFGGTCSGHCGDFFCGNDSCDDETDPCPRGYGCFQLIRVSNNLCTKGGGECQAGASCSADAPGELNESGSCSCLSDADCPTGSDPFGGPLTCVEPGPNGRCVDGSTCGPVDGLTCGDLL